MMPAVASVACRKGQKVRINTVITQPFRVERPHNVRDFVMPYYEFPGYALRARQFLLGLEKGC